jgi:hypothetical protein
MSKECAGNEEEHVVSCNYRAVGCGKESALRGILDQLTELVRNERKTKCEECECTGIDSGVCMTVLDDKDWTKIQDKVRYFPLLTKGDDCQKKGEVQYLATLVMPPTKIKSLCVCVPGKKIG